MKLIQIDRGRSFLLKVYYCGKVVFSQFSRNFKQNIELPIIEINIRRKKYLFQF